MPTDYHPQSKYENLVNPKRCKAAVFPGRGQWHQCLNTRGPSGYCATHSPEGEARRKKKQDEKSAHFNRKLDISALRQQIIDAAISHVEICGLEGKLHRAVAKLKKLVGE